MRCKAPKKLCVHGLLTSADIARFMRFVTINPDNGCWLWTGTKDRFGYGQFWWRGAMRWSHRFAAAAFLHDLPRYRHVHHKCRNKSCVSPFHLAVMGERQHGSLHGPEGVAA